MSRAILPRTPMAMPSAAASSATRVRSVCHGRTGSASPRRSARRCATSTPAPCSDASVPAAPPSCTASRSKRTRRSSARASSTLDQPVRHLEAERRRNRRLQQCSRRHHRVAVRLRKRRARAPPSRSMRIASRARCASRDNDVSMMSWLVAPRCTYARAAGDTASIRSLTSGAAGLPAATARRPIVARCRTPRRDTRRRSRLRRRLGRGLRRPPAPASAASTSSIACSHADVADGLVDRFAAEERADEPVSVRRRRSHVRPAGGCRNADLRRHSPQRALRAPLGRGHGAPDRSRWQPPHPGSTRA